MSRVAPPSRPASRSASRKKVAPGTRAANYRCSLPGLAGFVGIASPRAKTGLTEAATIYHIAAPNPFKLSAEREGFEPSVPCDTHDFQSCSFGHSDTSPNTTHNLASVSALQGRGWRGAFGPRACFRSSCFRARAATAKNGSEDCWSREPKRGATAEREGFEP